MKLSRIALNLIGQEMFQILEKSKKIERTGKTLIHFELGDPDFNTPEKIKQKAIDSILRNETHYCPSSGIFELKRAACEVTKRSRGFEPGVEQVLVTSGANMQIYLALACCCDSEDEVIIPCPFFPTYKAVISALNLKAIEYETVEDIEKLITKKTSAILINSPSNPSGKVLSKEEISLVYEICKKYDLLLLSDEVYSRQIYEGKFFSPSMIDKCKERVIVINGFSKSFAMTGWRLGVATGPAQIIQKMQMLLETIISCVPPFIQHAGVEALLGDQSELKKQLGEYKKRRDVMVEEINSFPGLKCLKPNGALYCWVDIQETNMSSKDYCEKMLQRGVVLCPGTVFGKEGFVRLCFCNSMENIKEGLRRMKHA